jgi:type IV pilus assembly protein PilV
MLMTTPAFHRRRSGSAGFTLIEVMISILIFSLGVLGTVALQARAGQFAEQNGDRSRAAILANELVSSLWANQSATPDATYLAAWKTRVATPAQSGLPNGSAAVTTTGNSATVQIYWKAPSIASGAASAAYTTTVVIQ